MPLCAGCGIDVEELILGLCSSCYKRKYGVARIPKQLESHVCRYCGSIRISGRWRRVNSFNEAIETLVYSGLSKLKPSYPLERVIIRSIRYKTKPDWRTRLDVEIVGVYRGISIIDDAEVIVRLKPSICPSCKIKLSGEYDVLVQIRGAYVEEDQIIRLLSNAGLLGRTIDIIQSKDGLNVYLEDMGAASKLARLLEKRYKVKISRVEHEHVGLTRKGKKRSRKTLTIRIEE